MATDADGLLGVRVFCCGVHSGRPDGSGRVFDERDLLVDERKGEGMKPETAWKVARAISENIRQVAKLEPANGKFKVTVENIIGTSMVDAEEAVARGRMRKAKALADSGSLALAMFRLGEASALMKSERFGKSFTVFFNGLLAKCEEFENGRSESESDSVVSSGNPSKVQLSGGSHAQAGDGVEAGQAGGDKSRRAQARKR